MNKVNAVTNSCCQIDNELLKYCDDPFNEVEVDVIFEKGEMSWKVPAFWRGDNRWSVRFAPPETGEYSYRWVCSCKDADAGFLNNGGILKAVDYNGKVELLSRGFIKVSDNDRYFIYNDGTPFFWLADTWWMMLTERASLEDFKNLTLDRKQKGFSVIQIVAGLYPEQPEFDKRAYNEAGFVWEEGYERINPEYFEYADRRIRYLVEMGIVPCIVGCWGYFYTFMGEEKIKKHWRNLMARYGAYPVVWCLAGETDMATCQSKAQEQREGWTRIARYVKEIDPFSHPLTAHPIRSGRRALLEDDLLDFDMLQTDHHDFKAAAITVTTVSESYTKTPPMPVLVGEVDYEGLMHQNHDFVQRYMFWVSILNGAAGHSYGANGIWQVNTKEAEHDPYPRGYGETPWDVAADFPGSTQLGKGKNLLMKYRWWMFEPHQEWIEPSGFAYSKPHTDWISDYSIVIGHVHKVKEEFFEPYAAGIPGEVRIIYIPLKEFSWKAPLVKMLETDVRYRAYYFNPISGKEEDLGLLPKGVSEWQAPNFNPCVDMVLVIERADI